jgi:hypothetical protein
MNQTLTVNELIEWDYDSKTKTIERILWIDEGNIVTYVININGKTGLPYQRTIAEILEALTSEIAVRVNNDPHLVFVNEDNIGDKEKQIRDKAWNIISTLVARESEPDIFHKSFRGPMIKEVAAKYEITEMTVYKYLRRYWQRGKTKNALLPDYYKSGGWGKRKTVGEKKIGRPRKHASEVDYGINVDEELQRIFRVAIKRFYNTPKKNSLSHAYRMMIKEYFSPEERYEAGVKKPIIDNRKNIPTEMQFRYWYQMDKNVKEESVSRKGAKKFELEDRAVLGSSTVDISGPGAKYQIDATIADIFLVSRYNRQWIIGRPVVYVLIDVYSRLITGVYVGLEGPSWLGAMMAIVNTATSKVQYCKEYGVDISNEDWPCHHMPDYIMADNGEMKSKSAESLLDSLNISLQYAPAFRADWKGIVERHFGVFQGKIKPFVPGYIDKDFQERGARDYRLDAKLDIYQVTQIIIKCILHHNRHHLSKLVRDEMMIAADILPVPIDIWEWGIANCSGRLKTFPEDVVKLSLLPRATARVTGKGITFKGLAYSCEIGIKEYWFEKARKKSWPIQISYDPRIMNNVYIWDPKTRTAEICYLLESHSRYQDKNLDEIIYLIEYEKLANRKGAYSNLQDDCDFAADIEAIVKQGKEMTNATLDKNVSDTARTKEIKSHRKDEKGEIRKNEAFVIGEAKDTKSQIDQTNIIPITNNTSRVNMLKNNQQERGRNDG